MIRRTKKQLPLLHCCHLCGAHEAEVRLDLKAMRDWPPRGIGHTESIDMTGTAHFPIQFCRGSQVVEHPCPHLISLCFDLPARPDYVALHDLSSLSLVWEHPWFRVSNETSAARREVSIQMHTDVIQSCHHPLQPKTLYFDRPIIRNLSYEDGRDCLVVGRVIYALEAERLLNDMLMTVQRVRSSDKTPKRWREHARV